MQQVHWSYQFYLETTVNALNSQKSSNTENCPIFNFFFVCVYNLVPHDEWSTQIEAV
jgi:hypothetical protein